MESKGIENFKYHNIIFSVIFHVFLLFTFLSIFFWTIISKSESKSLYNEIDEGINSVISEIQLPKDIYTEDSYKYLKSYFKGEDLTYSKNNKTLFQYNITIIVLLLITFIAIYLVRKYICKDFNMNLGEILLENIIVLIIVGGIEYYFFTQIASKYVPIVPSYMPNLLKDKLNKQLN